VDCVALLRRYRIADDDLRRAAEVTFRERKTHELPRRLPPPERGWQDAFLRYGSAYGLASVTLEEGWAELSAAWDRAMGRQRSGIL
jgi:hypothetical protein